MVNLTLLKLLFNGGWEVDSYSKRGLTESETNKTRSSLTLAKPRNSNLGYILCGDVLSRSMSCRFHQYCHHGLWIDSSEWYLQANPLVSWCCNVCTLAANVR